ncbi:MAG TPA: UPF0262 family protein [Hypericibacter adhaerens]|uniref:UPF0262 protein FRZ61_36910 n=1 Tax=Hypericibacter adhaerens TaxID=2602016 RepID=A0A5J6N192_9PROT|nr:UPF0262 family protein [Hypericibacter adhaerens]QEX23752.1 UPF0262 protein [Hypericibacter adhaerens]HWA43369.1 UPF0262 family protein [Hypericibacter adhaerens]
MEPPAAPPTNRIARVTLDERSVVRRSPEVEHERAVAIYDLIEENSFCLVEGPAGPYNLSLGIEDNRLVLDIAAESAEPLAKHILSLTPFRRIVKDYFTVCESYYEAIKRSSPSQIEAIDMGRRGLHNEGAELLRERLAGKIELDGNTARRLFTLICVLHIRA